MVGMKTVIQILSSNRFWEHMPVGILNAMFLYRLPLLGVCFFVGFIVYELWQCYTTHDLAHNDIVGHLGGMAVGGVALLVYLSCW